jgi:hypothetical protein
METVQTLDFQPLTISLIERTIPPRGGVYILARKMADSFLKPFRVSKTLNMRDTLRRFFLHEMDHVESFFKNQPVDDHNSPVWVRIFSIEGPIHQSEIERLLSSELLGDDAETSHFKKLSMNSE